MLQHCFCQSVEFSCVCFGTYACVHVCVHAYMSVQTHMFIYVFNLYIPNTKNIISLKQLIAMKLAILVIIE